MRNVWQGLVYVRGHKHDARGVLGVPRGLQMRWFKQPSPMPGGEIQRCQLGRVHGVWQRQHVLRREGESLRHMRERFLHQRGHQHYSLTLRRVCARVFLRWYKHIEGMPPWHIPEQRWCVRVQRLRQRQPLLRCRRNQLRDVQFEKLHGWWGRRDAPNVHGLPGWFRLRWHERREELCSRHVQRQFRVDGL